MGSLLGYNRLAETAEQTMFDRGQVGRNLATGQDGPNEPTSNWAYGGETICAVDDDPKSETEDGAEAAIVDAIVRLPRDTEIDVDDRFKWTKTHGIALGVPQEYRVISQPRRGPSALTAELKLITGNTEN